MTCYLQQIINHFGKKISTRLCSESRKGLVFLWVGNNLHFTSRATFMSYILFISFYITFSIVLLVGVQFTVYTANSSPFSTGRRFLSNICNISEIFYS